MAYRVELSEEAVSNIREIYAYINASESPAAARWYRGLRALIFSLDHEPFRGRPTPESKELRQLLYGNKPHIYRIIYRVDSARLIVQVLHIRHGARQSFDPAGLASSIQE